MTLPEYFFKVMAPSVLLVQPGIQMEEVHCLWKIGCMVHGDQNRTHCTPEEWEQRAMVETAFVFHITPQHSLHVMRSAMSGCLYWHNLYSQ